MDAKLRIDEVPQNDNQSRKPWQPPVLEALMVEETESDLTRAIFDFHGLNAS
jgi:hypothetical protein